MVATIAHSQEPYLYMEEWSCHSPDGKFVLRITPTAKRGYAPANYIFTKNGRPLWKTTKPYFLVSAAISNNGNVFGANYAQRPNGTRNPDEVLEVRLFVASGKDQRLESVLRKTALASDIPDSPIASESLITNDGRHATLSIENAHQTIGGRWRRTLEMNLWRYDLSSGRRVATVDAAESFGDFAFCTDIISFASIPGTEFFALVGVINREDKQQTTAKVIDLDGKTIWSKEVPDWTNVEVTNSAGSFLLKSDDKVTNYGVVRKQTGYVVRQIPDVPPPKAKEIAEPPSIPIQLVSEITIGKQKPDGSLAVGKNRIAVANKTRVSAFDFSGELVFVRVLNLSARYGYVLSVDPDGSVFAAGDISSVKISPDGKQLSEWKVISNSSAPWDKVCHFTSADKRWSVRNDIGDIEQIGQDGDVSKTISRTARHWLGYVIEADSSPNGSISMLSLYGAMTNEIWAVRAFSKSGRELADFSVPSWMGLSKTLTTASAFSISCDDRRLVIAGSRGLFAFDLRGKPLWRLPLILENAKGALIGRSFLIDGTNLLAVYDLKTTVRFYKIPS